MTKMGSRVLLPPVGTTMRVLGVMFDSRLSWENHILHVSSIVKKKKHALRKLSSDICQAELLNIAHGSFSSVLYFAAGTWLNEALQKKLLKRLEVFLKCHIADSVWKEKTRMQYCTTSQQDQCCFQ